MTNLPVVSIIIPSYNRPDYLERLLESITKISYTNLEVVIVDDNSNCDYFTFIDSYQSKLRIKYLKNDSNLYAEKSRKKGFNSSSGEYLIFCDDDDYYFNSKFVGDAIEIFNEHEDLAFVSFGADMQLQPACINSSYDLNVCGYIKGFEYIRFFQIGYKKPLSTFTTMFRRQSLTGESVFFNDSSLYLFALTNGDAYISKTVIGYYTIHSSNITSDIKMDFIFDVLDSKYYIYKTIKKSVEWNSFFWWRKQLYLTSKFYLRSGIKTKRDFDVFRRRVISRYKCNPVSFYAFCAKEFLYRKGLFNERKK